MATTDLRDRLQPALQLKPEVNEPPARNGKPAQYSNQAE